MRDYIARLIGWSDTAAIDRAARSLRLSTHRVIPLVLAGEEWLPRIALSIHRRCIEVDRARGSNTDRPFVMCDPRRHSGKSYESVRSPISYRTASTALEAARGGTVCMVSSRMPPDFEALREALREVRLVICRPLSEFGVSIAPYEIDPIMIQPVDTRADLDTIVAEYAREAGLTAPADIAWVRKHAHGSHGEIESACQRLAAVRNAGGVIPAARAIGMAPVSLGRWLGRRGWRAA
jgi:hypothetical protein